MVARMLAGDEESFAAIYRRHHPDLYRFAWHMTGSPHRAEEVVQDTFLAFLRQPERWDAARGALRPFLFGITRNLARRNWAEPLDEPIEGDVAAPADLLADMDRDERIDAVREAVLSLPETYREVVALCDMDEASYEEAAAIVGVAVGTVRSRLHRGRALVAAKLRVRFGVTAERGA